ncbi:SHOCT domain-containing protein [Candidatus Pelagibacter sp.]|nr:SHOCT domain-containing protein [Candidatus Pelagibacter sp.]|tara:strand:- start:234 stop:500 length:267 start_codon:yes stop_codon:yes gene_type:complete
MEKIIFLSLALPVLGFVLYLGVSSILKGFKAKNDKLLEETKNEEEVNDSSKFTNNELSDELVKLSELFQNGSLTEEEFEKAKKKILEG